MKKKIVFICLLLINSLVYSQYQKKDTLEFNKEFRKFLHDFALMSYNLCNKGEFIELSEKNSEKGFRERFTKEKVIKACKWYEERYGRIISLRLEEIIENNIKIFRYKVTRENSDVPQEIRVYLNSINLIYHISSKIYWSDQYSKGNEYPDLFIHSKNQISNIRKKDLESFVLKSYSKCERDYMPLITKENTEYRSYRKDWIPQMIAECDSIKSKNGGFKILKLEQYLCDDVYSKVYRFKIKFEKLAKPSEIRIFTTIKDKYRGIFVVDKWYNNYLELSKAIKKAEQELKK